MRRCSRRGGEFFDLGLDTFDFGFVAGFLRERKYLLIDREFVGVVGEFLEKVAIMFNGLVLRAVERAAMCEQQKQALGASFKLKDFHNRFLSYGSVPVKTIKQLMAEPEAPAGP